MIKDDKPRTKLSKEMQEFTDGIEARIEDFIIQQLNCEMYDFDWRMYQERIVELKWALEKFIQIKN